MRENGITAVYAMVDIEKDRGLETKHDFTLGILSERRSRLRQFGISECQCYSRLEEEELLLVQPRIPEVEKETRRIQDDQINIVSLLQRMQEVVRPDFVGGDFSGRNPVLFNQTSYDLIVAFKKAGCLGQLILTVWIETIAYAKHFNDNIHIVWNAAWLKDFYDSLTDEESPAAGEANADYDNAFRGIPWNAEKMNYFTFCEYELDTGDENTSIIYMLDKPTQPAEYHRLAVNERGLLEYTTFENNQRRFERFIGKLKAKHTGNEEGRRRRRSRRLGR